MWVAPGLSRSEWVPFTGLVRASMFLLRLSVKEGGRVGLAPCGGVVLGSTPTPVQRDSGQIHLRLKPPLHSLCPGTSSPGSSCLPCPAPLASPSQN